MADVVIFAPSPVLSITIEDHPDAGDVHIHPGGQGVWQARMLRSLSRSVALCSILSGEPGRILAHALHDEGIEVVAVRRESRGGVHIQDRRDGQRQHIVEHGGDILTRHELDELYGATIRHALDADVVILSGPSGEGLIPPDYYRRLAADLRTSGVRVLVDLAGERLDAAIAGGVEVAKVSDEELLADGRIRERSAEAIIPVMHQLHAAGAEVVIVTRAHEPLLVLHDGVLHEVTGPVMEVVNASGAGDSFVGAFAARLADGGGILDAVRLGAAAGALNVTRHGLGTGDKETIERVEALVRIRQLPQDELAATRTRELSPDEFAAGVERDG